MISLKYKQLGRGSVKGSQKVYYCAAPGDHEKFFDSIAASLAVCYPDISLWYPDDGGAVGQVPSEEAEDWLFDLSQMNLFIIPVTRNLKNCSTGSAEISSVCLPWTAIPRRSRLRQN